MWACHERRTTGIWEKERASDEQTGCVIYRCVARQCEGKQCVCLHVGCVWQSNIYDYHWWLSRWHTHTHTRGALCVRVRVECQRNWSSAPERRELVCYSRYLLTYLIIISISTCVNANYTRAFWLDKVLDCFFSPCYSISSRFLVVFSFISSGFSLFHEAVNRTWKLFEGPACCISKWFYWHEVEC